MLLFFLSSPRLASCIHIPFSYDRHRDRGSTFWSLQVVTASSVNCFHYSTWVVLLCSISHFFVDLWLRSNEKFFFILSGNIFSLIFWIFQFLYWTYIPMYPLVIFGGFFCPLVTTHVPCFFKFQKLSYPSFWSLNNTVTSPQHSWFFLFYLHQATNPALLVFR